MLTLLGPLHFTTPASRRSLVNDTACYACRIITDLEWVRICSISSGSIAVLAFLPNLPDAFELLTRSFSVPSLIHLNPIAADMSPSCSFGLEDVYPRLEMKHSRCNLKLFAGVGTRIKWSLDP